MPSKGYKNYNNSANIEDKEHFGKNDFLSIRENLRSKVRRPKTYMGNKAKDTTHTFNTCLYSFSFPQDGDLWSHTQPCSGWTAAGLCGNHRRSSLDPKTISRVMFVLNYGEKALCHQQKQKCEPIV